MSLNVNDERTENYPGGIKVYSIKPTRAIDCRTCQYGGMSTCNLPPTHCMGGSEYVAAKPVQFWRRQ